MLTVIVFKLNIHDPFPIEVEAYFYQDDGEFKDSTVHCNELQKNNYGKLYIHRCGVDKKVPYKNSNRVSFNGQLSF